MKYIIELEKLEGTNLYKAKGCNTLVFDEKGIKRILKPYNQEIDWSKVPVDTLIEVSLNNKDWEKRYFARYDNGKVYAWSDGRTSKTECDKYHVTVWKYARLAEEEK